MYVCSTAWKLTITNMATARNFEVISNQFDELSGSVKAVGPDFSAMCSIMRHNNNNNNNNNRCCNFGGQKCD